MSRPMLGLTADGREVAIPHVHVTGVLAVMTRVRIMLETIRGTWPSDDLFGLPYLAWMEAPATPLVEIEGAIRQQLADLPGVDDVRSVSASRDGETLTLSVELDIVADARRVSVAIGDLDDGAGPAWYLVRHSAVAADPLTAVLGVL